MPKAVEPLNLIRSSIRELHPYHLEDREVRIKLNQNESPFDLPMSLKQEIVQDFVRRPWNRYPSFTTASLKTDLARYLEFDSEGILLGNGSNDLLQLLISIALPQHSKILIVEPTFTIYQQLARIAQSTIVQLDFREDLQFPVQEILAALSSQRVDLCILSSPNSPTGVMLPKDDLQAILSQAKGLVLVDEAYHEFASTDYLRLLGRFDNLILSRTFSKAFGLAGLRLGYFIGAPDVIREIGKARLPYNLNCFSEFVASRLLANMEVVAKHLASILTEKERLWEALSAINGLKVYPSTTNFFMIESRIAVDKLFEELASRAILVRDISKQHALLRNKLRVTVGAPEENQELVKALQDILESDHNSKGP